MTQYKTRRAILTAGLPSVVAAAVKPPAKKSKPLPAVGEFVRIVDPVTESTLVRLTNPAFASYLPAAANRFISVKERFLLFSSDRTGRPTPFYLDLRTGVLRALAPTDDLRPASLSLDSAGRTVYLLDGTDLKRVALGIRKVDLLTTDVSAFSLGNSPSELIVVRKGRLELLTTLGGSPTENAPLAESVDWCVLRPDGKGCAFGRLLTPEEQEIWYVALSPSPAAHPVLLAKGRVSNPLWSPDGKSLMFLRQVPKNGLFVSEIHETIPETLLEQRVASTSQFAAFSPNGDGSVFVGASGSRAQPTIILLLRSAQREMTLCEHHATRAVTVDPVFSPDSRRVYFQSDHEGKSALYSVNVELLVEPTASSTL